MTTKRHLCFTAWQVPQFDETKMRYMCYGEETCPTTGKLHYQGYLELYDAHRYPGIKKLLKIQDCKFFPRAGNRDQAVSYCRGNYTTVDGRYKPLNSIFVEKGDFTRKKKDYSGANRGVESLLPTPRDTPPNTETFTQVVKSGGFHDPDGASHYAHMVTLGKEFSPF